MKAMVASREHRFFREIAAATTRVLLIDYDGTVAPFSADRGHARPYPAVPALLRQIMAGCSTRLIIVSGRSAREIPRLLGIYPAPEIWGSHGVEKLHSNGRYEECNVNDEALAVLAQAELRLIEEGFEPHIEVKLAAIAVHWRGLPPADALKLRSKTQRLLKRMVSGADLILTEFDEGVELRLRSANKGESLRTVLEGLDDKIPVAYLGDDVDDEDAFRVLNGRGLTVLVKPEAQLTAAQIVLRPPNELVGFLERWIEACGRKA
jgi:trehalose 6-phosphate phosphatase